MKNFCFILFIVLFGTLGLNAQTLLTCKEPGPTTLGAKIDFVSKIGQDITLKVTWDEGSTFASENLAIVNGTCTDCPRVGGLAREHGKFKEWKIRQTDTQKAVSVSIAWAGSGTIAYCKDNTPVIIPGTVINNALAFDGSGDVVELGVPSFYSNSFTIEGWIKAKRKDGMIITTYRGLLTGVSAQVNTSGTISFGVRNPPANAGGAAVVGKKNVADDNWHHFALVKGNDKFLYLYIDGELDGKSQTKAGDFSTTTDMMRMGMNVLGGTNHTRYFQGSMDEIRCWSIARTQTDIKANMNKSLSGTEAGLAVYYKFNQGTANATNKAETTLKDEKGKLNGTLTNFTLSGSTSNFTTGYQPPQ